MVNDNTLDRDKIIPVDVTDSVEEIVTSSIRNIIACLGDDPDRPGLIETPSRVYRMYKEVFEGMDYTNEEIAKMFNKCFDESSGDLVTVTNIPIFSYCEHHLALMYDMSVHVGYIPKGKVIGLSKVARIADMVGKRLQLQERIGCDIADILTMILNTEDIIVVVEGEHSCMTARGIKARGAVTRTSSNRGKDDTAHELRKEFYSLLK